MCGITTMSSRARTGSNSGLGSVMPYVIPEIGTAYSWAPVGAATTTVAYLNRTRGSITP